MTSSSATINYAPVTRVAVCTFARRRPWCVTACVAACIRLRLIYTPVTHVAFCTHEHRRPRFVAACVRVRLIYALVAVCILASVWCQPLYCLDVELADDWQHRLDVELAVDWQHCLDVELPVDWQQWWPESHHWRNLIRMLTIHCPLVADPWATLRQLHRIGQDDARTADARTASKTSFANIRFFRSIFTHLQLIQSFSQTNM